MNIVNDNTWIVYHVAVLWVWTSSTVSSNLYSCVHINNYLIDPSVRGLAEGQCPWMRHVLWLLWQSWGNQSGKEMGVRGQHGQSVWEAEHVWLLWIKETRGGWASVRLAAKCLALALGSVAGKICRTSRGSVRTTGASSAFALPTSASDPMTSGPPSYSTSASTAPASSSVSALRWPWVNCRSPLSVDLASTRASWSVFLFWIRSVQP